MSLRSASAVVAVVALSIGILGLGPTQTSRAADVESTPVGRFGEILGVADFDQRDDLPPSQSFLDQIAPDQRFERLRRVSITVADPSGSPVEITMTPGTVTVVSPLSISIVPNGMQSARSFDVTPNTRVRAMPAPGAFQAVVPGDNVVVVTDGTGAAVLIAKEEAPRPTSTAVPTSPTPPSAPSPASPTPAVTPSTSPQPASDG